jgi:plastocyanin
VTVKAGDKVTWTNKDSVGHDVTGDNFKSGDSGGLQNGDTFSHTFDKKGKFDYVCTVHPGMTGSVTVK